VSALLALTFAALSGAVEAEREFSATAQAEGQWTAFRQFAAEESVLFTAGPIDAHEALANRADPAISVVWWPARSFVSCDGELAINTGPWLRAHQSRQGSFVTVWRKQPDGGWRWLLDDGRDLETPIPAGEEPEVRQASCDGMPPPPDRAPVAQAAPRTSGASPDGTLRWRVDIRPDGSRRLSAWLYDGARMEPVLTHDVPAEIP
jgi:hypothetical protein